MIFWGTFFSKQKQKKCEKIAIKSHQLYDHNKKKGKKVAGILKTENMKQETKIITIFRTKISID